MNAARRLARRAPGPPPAPAALPTPAALRALCALLALAAVTAWPAAAQVVTPGQIDAELELNAEPGSFPGDLDAQDFFGVGAVAVGDLDGDGLTELAVGASGDDDGGGRRGAVWILFMQADGTPGAVTKINSTSPVFGGDLSNWDEFGDSLAAVGDLDDDGVPDLAVGAPRDDDVCCEDGAVWILFLTSSGTPRAAAKLSDRTPGLEGVLLPYDNFGRAVAGLGDLDGDGVEDLAVGTRHDTVSAVNSGAVFLLFLHPDGSVKSWAELSEDTFGAMGLGGITDLGFGSSLALLDDLDGNGTPELAVGTTYANGELYVLFLEADGTATSIVTIGEGQGGFDGDLGFNDFFGDAMAPLGDLDGNGVGDLAVGASLSNDGGTNTGSLWLLFLEPDGTVRDELELSMTSGGFTGPLANSDWFASSVAVAGDLGADDTLEVVVGAPLVDDGATNAGSIWILSLQVGPWFDLGLGLAGTNNKPRLKGEGLLVDDAPIELKLSRAKANAPATLVVGFTLLGAPFKGGWLIPATDLLIGATTDPLGKIDLPAIWPPGVPPGVPVWFQWWIVDEVGVQGFAASNGLQAWTP